MLVLLILAVLSEWLQPGVISQATTSISVHPERAYKDAPTRTVAQLFISVFRLGTLAMALCLCFPAESGFSFVAYLAVCGVLLGVALVKMACDLLVDYTFRITKTYGEVYEHYSNLMTLTCVAIYALLLVLTYTAGSHLYKTIAFISFANACSMEALKHTKEWRRL